MATLSESLVIKIGADTKDLEQGVKKAQDTTVKAGKKMAQAQEPLIDRLDKVKSGFDKVRGVVTFFSAAIVGATAVGLKHNDTLAKLRGTASLAGKDYEKLAATVKGAAADGFIRVGTAAKKATESIATGFGDASGALDAFRSSLKLEDLGFGPAGELEAAMKRAQLATGKTADEVRDLGTKAGLLNAGFAPALETFSDLKPAFDLVNLSFESFIENVGALRAKGATTETAIGAVSGLVDTFRGNNEGAAAALEELGIQFGGTKLAGSNLATTLALLTQKQADYASLVKGALGDSQQYADVLRGIGSGGSTFIDQIGRAGDVVSDFAESSKQGRSQLDGLKASFNQSVDAFGELAGSATALADNLQAVLDKMKAIADWIAKNKDKAINIAGDISFGVGGTAIMEFIASLQSGQGFGQSLGNIFQQKNAGGEILALSGGGGVPGVGNTDTVPAMLTPGEYVIRKEVAEKIKPLLAMLNGLPSQSLWETPLAGTTVKGHGLLDLLGIPAPLGGLPVQNSVSLGMGVSQSSTTVQQTVSAIKQGLGTLQLNSGGEVPTTTNNNMGGLTVNLPGVQKIDETFVRNELMPMIQRFQERGYDRRSVLGA